jgi:hypothetical protein
MHDLLLITVQSLAQQHLPKHLAKVWLLWYEEGLPDAALAKRTGIPLGSIHKFRKQADALMTPILLDYQKRLEIAPIILPDPDDMPLAFRITIADGHDTRTLEDIVQKKAVLAT